MLPAFRRIDTFRISALLLAFIAYAGAIPNPQQKSLPGPKPTTTKAAEDSTTIQELSKLVCVNRAYASNNASSF
jgi:hypothetical protein